MITRTQFIAILLVCSSTVLFNAIGTASADNMAMNTGQVVSANLSGKVTQVVDSAGYTYAEVDTGKEKVWAAGPVTPLKAGDMISFATKMPMNNFHSQSMNRDFSVIYFVDNFVTDGKQPAAHAQVKQKSAAMPVESIKKAEGGKTIAEIYAGKKDLNGKTIRVRGKITRLTTGVLDKNWLHIIDSTTQDDLTVTTNDKANIGDVVVVEGKIGLDKDYGYGYVYAVIMEDAKITKK